MLSGRNIFITGGASGIGLASARAFIGYGARVAIMDICGQERLQTVQAELGAHCWVVPGDVTKPEDVKRAVSTAAAAMGSLDGALNCAGAAENAYIYELTDEAFDRTLKVCLYGTMYCVREEARYMIDHKVKGAILNLSSMNGEVPYRTYVPYASAKAAINMLTKTASLDLAPFGIRVNALCPGFTETPLTASVNTPEINRVTVTHMPMKRWSKAEEQAEPAAFLLSDRASYITGTLLMADGGMSNMAYPDLRRILAGESFYAE